MKDAFYHLEEAKRRRIEAAALEEFGAHGYDRGSTDRIIRRSGISKGGLYEYIASKEELFLHTVELAYGALYDHIQANLRRRGGPEADVLARLRSAAGAALEFYLKSPETVRLIASLNSVIDGEVRLRAETVFRAKFRELLAGADFASSRFPADRVVDLLMWMLVKTRNDFISESEKAASAGDLSAAYLADWDFILSVLADGIYKQRGSACSD